MAATAAGAKAPLFVIPAEETEGEEGGNGGGGRVATETSEAGGGSTVEAASSVGLGEEEGPEFEEEGRGPSMERYRSKYRLLELRKDEAPVRQNEVRVMQKVRWKGPRSIDGWHK